MARDIGLFYEFFRVSGCSIDTQTYANNLINRFLGAAKYGTIREDGGDPLGLFWKGMTRNRAKLLQSNLRTFLKALDDFAPRNALSESKFAQSSRSALALELRKSKSLLFHLSKSRAGSSPPGRSSYLPAPMKSVKKFPRDKLASLVLEGCRLQRRRHQTGKVIIDQFNVNMVMSLCLLIGGGLRKSEPLHLWVDDVRVPEGKVYLYHPAEGVVSGSRGNAVRRREYLRDVYGLVPRNTLPADNKFHSGWKNLLIDDSDRMRSEVYWCHPFWRDLFMRSFVEYRDHLRPDDCGHPYLFVSLADGSFGERWTIWAFNEGWKATLKRIGLEPSAWDGINPHGLRHAYGQLLRNMKLHPQFIQRAMHHQSPLSQMIYTAPEPHEVNAALQAAASHVANQSWGQLAGSNAFKQVVAQRKDPASVCRAWGIEGV
jgi:integrase